MKRTVFGERKKKKDSRLGLSLVKSISVPLLTAATLKLLLCGGGFCGGVGVLLGETFDATGGVHQLLLTGEERVAIGADFNVQPVPFDGGTGLEIVSASAMDGYGMVVRMNTGLHESPFYRVRSAPTPAMAGTTEASLGREAGFHYNEGDGILQNGGESGSGVSLIFFLFRHGPRKFKPTQLPEKRVNGDERRSRVGDIGRDFVGKGALDAIRSERGDHVKIAAAGLDACVPIAE